MFQYTIAPARATSSKHPSPAPSQRNAFARAAANSNSRDHTPKNGTRPIGGTDTGANTDPVEVLPANFDPRQHPILSVHWFGCRTPAESLAEIVNSDLFRLADALHGQHRHQG